VGGDQGLLRLQNHTGVSIHAPTWGATRLGGQQYQTRHVSIHAPTWGATTAVMVRTLVVMRFNPRPHVGGDSPAGSPAGEATGVSIHAPTWGATAARCLISGTALVSIHAPTWGATSRPRSSRA